MDLQFFLDNAALMQPVAEAESPQVISGWVLLPDDARVESVEFHLGGKLTATGRVRQRRPDVQAYFKNERAAMYSGFCTELPLDEWVGKSVEMEIQVVGGSGRHTLVQNQLQVMRKMLVCKRRKRGFDLASILACPECGGMLRLGEEVAACRVCHTEFEMRRGTPIFTPPDCPVDSRLHEQCHTHAYSKFSQEIIEQCRGGLILDFGCGNPDPHEHFPHVVLHEAVQYQQSDVVCITPRLPYRDEVFDAVISQAVFEHVPRPWMVAAELYRVLKPGGRIHLDTAFMQPFHGDPCHYFNMTISGLRVIFADFEEREVGIKPYQSVSHSLRMQFETLRGHLNDGAWAARFDEFLRALKDDSLNKELDSYGQEVLGAGVFFDGVKPQRAIRLMAA